MVTSIAGLPGGNRNTNGTFNNLGKNGNWWSSSESTTEKAWNRNLNYNNGKFNRNNNNESCGFSVRCLRDLMETGPAFRGAFFDMQLGLFLPPQTSIPVEEVFQAYFDCRKNKRNTFNALSFEKHFEQNLFDLHAEINAGNYQPGRSIAFIVNKPVKREIFAANFRDRVVHHLIINKLNPLFEQTFIPDSYACRVGKGTHFGIQQANRFIRACSKNYTEDCYILKLDVQGFFMNINRNLLWERLQQFIINNYHLADKSLVMELTSKFIFNDPTTNCIIKGSLKNWDSLPKDKSLFHSPPDCGLPIGNLTSQVFANFYLHLLDQYIKSELGITFYGRYVDDFIIVHQDKVWLKNHVPRISVFLKHQLQLTLHPKKIYLQHYSKGVKVLGVLIKPNRIYIDNRTKGNFYAAVQKQNEVVRQGKPDGVALTYFLSSMNSYLGIMKHYKTYNLRSKILIENISGWWWNYVYVSGGFSKFVLRIKSTKHSFPHQRKFQQS